MRSPVVLNALADGNVPARLEFDRAPPFASVSAQGLDLALASLDDAELFALDVESFASRAALWFSLGTRRIETPPLRLWLYHNDSNFASASPPPPPPTQVWGRYRTVFHLEDTATATWRDASAAALTLSGNATRGLSTVGPGYFTSAQTLSNATSYRGNLNLDQNVSTVNVTTKVQLWVFPSRCNGTDDLESFVIFTVSRLGAAFDDIWLRLAMQSDCSGFAVGTGRDRFNDNWREFVFTTAIPERRWSLLTVSVAPRTFTPDQEVSFFVNNTLRGLFITSAFTAITQATLTVGGPEVSRCSRRRQNNCQDTVVRLAFPGGIDELRISTAREQDEPWYLNQWALMGASRPTLVNAGCRRPSASLSSVSLELASAPAGASFNASVQIVDEGGAALAGNCADSLLPVFVSWLFSPAGAASMTGGPFRVAHTQNGVFVGQLRFNQTGTVLVTASFVLGPLASPATILSGGASSNASLSVLPSAPSASQSSVFVPPEFAGSAPRVVRFLTNESALFFVTVRDTFGNVRGAGNDELVCNATSASTSSVSALACNWTSLFNGTYRANVTLVVPDTLPVSVLAAGVEVAVITLSVNAPLNLTDGGGGGGGNGTDGNAPAPAEASSVNAAAVAGGAVGGVVALFLLALLVFLLVRRQRERKKRMPPDLRPWAFRIADVPGGGGGGAAAAAAAAGGSGGAGSISREAQTALQEVLLEADYTLAVAICQAVPRAKLDQAVKALFYFYYAKRQDDKILAVCKRFITSKLQEAMAAGSANLFRTDNEATKAMNVYVAMLGLPYLYDVLSPLFERKEFVVDGKVELDPSRMSGKNVDSALSRYTILQVAQTAFVRITGSVNRMPPEMRELARHLDAEVRVLAASGALKAKRAAPASDEEDGGGGGGGGGGSSDGVAARPVGEADEDEEGKAAGGREADVDRLPRIALAGMVFLRFFCPAISAPSAFGLMRERPDEDHRRVLTLVTKTLQNLANGVRFGGKEEYMKQLNDFMDSNEEKLKAYLASLAAARAPAASVAGHAGLKVSRSYAGALRLQPQPGVVPWSLNALARLLHSYLPQVAHALQGDLRVRLERAVALSLPPLPPKASWQMSGYLVKRGGRVKTWKRRFFVLHDEYLWYCKSEGGAALGVICLAGASVLKGQGVIAIDHPHQRTHMLRPDEADPAALDRWADKLIEQVATLKRALLGGEPNALKTAASGAADSAAAGSATGGTSRPRLSMQPGSAAARAASVAGAESGEVELESLGQEGVAENTQAAQATGDATVVAALPSTGDEKHADGQSEASVANGAPAAAAPAEQQNLLPKIHRRGEVSVDANPLFASSSSANLGFAAAALAVGGSRGVESLAADDRWRLAEDSDEDDDAAERRQQAQQRAPSQGEEEEKKEEAPQQSQRQSDGAAAAAARGSVEEYAEGRPVPGTSWVLHYTDEMLPYYYNTETGESRWELDEPQH